MAGVWEQAGSPGAQEVARTEVRPGSGGPDSSEAVAETVAVKPKKSIDRKVAEIATELFRRVDFEPCATWWIPTAKHTADPIPRCGP